MGKSKELFMKLHYSNVDLEREHLINDSIAQSWEEEEYNTLKQELNVSDHLTKIEVADGIKTRIETGKEEQAPDKQIEIPGFGF